MLLHVGLTDVLMCSFILISINNKVKKSRFLYRMDQEKGENRYENLHLCFHDNIILNALF